MEIAELDKILTSLLLVILVYVWVNEAEILEILRFWHFVLLSLPFSVAYWFIRAKKALSSKSKVQLSEESIQESLPPVSILIPAWNEAKTIPDTINSVLEIDYPKFEIIVIAGGDDDTYKKAVEISKNHHDIKVLKQEPLGKNAALNKGLEHAKGEIIVLLDADAVVEKSWLKSLISPIVQGEAIATTGNHSSDKEMNWVLAYNCMIKIRERYIDGMDSLFGAGSIAMSRKVIDKIEKFDEKIMVGVDWHLNNLLIERGFKTKFVPDARLKTDLPETLVKFIKTESRWKRALLHLNLKNIFSFATPVLFVALPVLYFISTELRFFTMLLFSWTFYYSFIIIGHISLAIESYAYSGEKKWLRYIWAPPIFLIMDFIYSSYAILTINKITPHFEGPRKL